MRPRHRRFCRRVAESLRSLGYGYAKPELLPWLAANAKPMIAVNGPTNGTTTLWFIDKDALQAGADARVAYPANEREQ